MKDFRKDKRTAEAVQQIGAWSWTAVRRGVPAADMAAALRWLADEIEREAPQKNPRGEYPTPNRTGGSA